MNRLGLVIILILLGLLLSSCKQETALEDTDIFVVSSEFYEILDNEEGGMIGTVSILDPQTIAVGVTEGMTIYHLDTDIMDTYSFTLNQIRLDILSIDEERQSIIGFDLGTLYEYDFDGNLIQEIEGSISSGAIRIDDVIINYSYSFAIEPKITLYDLELQELTTYAMTLFIIGTEQQDELSIYAHNPEDGTLYYYQDQEFTQLSDAVYDYVIDIETIGDDLIVKGYDFATKEYQIIFEQDGESTVLYQSEEKLSITFLDGYQGFVLCNVNGCETSRLYDSNGNILHTIQTEDQMGYITTETYYINNINDQQITLYNLQDEILETYDMSNVTHYGVRVCGGHLFAITNDGSLWLHDGAIIPIRVLGYASRNSSIIVHRKDTEETFLIENGANVTPLEGDDIKTMLRNETTQLAFLVLYDTYFSFRYYSDTWMELYIYDYEGNLLHNGKIFAQIQLGVMQTSSQYSGYYLISENKEEHSIRLVYYK